MRRLARAIFLVTALGPGSAFAEDVVRIKFAEGMTASSTSSESVNLEVTRAGSTRNGPRNDVDNFFDAVRSILSRYRIDRDWAQLAPDSSYVEVIVQLDGRTRRFIINASDRARSRIPPKMEEMDNDTRYLAAMEQIIALARERAGTRVFKQ